MFALSLPVICFLLASFSLSHAETMDFNVGVGAGASYLSFSNKGFDDAVIPTVSVLAKSNNFSSIELTIGWGSVKSSNRTDNGERMLSPDLSVIPVLFTVQQRFPAGRLSPYVGFGVGFYQCSFESSQQMKDIIKMMKSIDPTFDISISGNAGGPHLALGADYLIGKNIAIGADAKHSWMPGPKITYTSVGKTTVTDLNMDNTLVTASLKFLF